MTSHTTKSTFPLKHYIIQIKRKIRYRLRRITVVIDVFHHWMTIICSHKRSSVETVCIHSQLIPGECELIGRLCSQRRIGRPHLPRIPWPCKGASAFQRSRTWRPRTGSLRRWGCPSPRTPAGSGSSGSDFACWSSSWRSVDASLCGAPGRRPWEEQPAKKSAEGGRKKQEKGKEVSLTHRRRYWWVWYSENLPHLVVWWLFLFPWETFSHYKEDLQESKCGAAVVNTLLYTDETHQHEFHLLPMWSRSVDRPTVQTFKPQHPHTYITHRQAWPIAQCIVTWQLGVRMGSSRASASTRDQWIWTSPLLSHRSLEYGDPHCHSCPGSRFLLRNAKVSKQI